MSDEQPQPDERLTQEQVGTTVKNLFRHPAAPWVAVTLGGILAVIVAVALVEVLA